MKKLNRKGFTLVELLAVIIILAIVVGITIPAVLTTTSKAREKAFQTSVESFANWLDRQYEAYRLGNDLIAKTDENFIRACTDENGIKDSCTISEELLVAGGLKPDNYDLTRDGTDGGIQYKDYNGIKLKDGRYCVKLFGSINGDYNTYDSKTNNESCFERNIILIPDERTSIEIDDGSRFRERRAK